MRVTTAPLRSNLATADSGECSRDCPFSPAPRRPGSACQQYGRIVHHAGSAPQRLTNSKAVVDAVVNGPSAHRRASVRMEVCARWVSVYHDYVSFLGFD